jgi:hypothetical protein
MARSTLPGGSFRFALEIDLPRDSAWLGKHEISFEITNGVGVIGGFEIRPEVTILAGLRGK